MILTTKQERAVQLCVERFKNKEKYTVISGYAGSGKAQPVDTIIPTPNGKKLLGELKVGDYVYDRHGKPTKILGVYPQGFLDSYIVTLKDGRQTKCNDEHLWSYYTSKGNLATKTLREMIDAGLKREYRGGGFKFKIPVNKPVEMEEKKLEIDPYVFGVFLGDGCCKQRQLTVSSNDFELVEEVGRLINGTPVKNSDFNYNWTFLLKEPVTENEITKTKIQTKDFFKGYEEYIELYCFNKSIPDIYKYNSIENRLNLLQGLFDTDGSISSVDEERYNIKYTSTSKKLIDDIQEILWSLGYESSITEDNRKDKYTNNICYNLNVNIPNEEKYKLFRLKRKKDIALEAANYEKYRDYSKMSIISIKKEKEQREMVCIYVDNMEHLYLTNDYIVTHNTTVVNFVIEEFKNTFNIDDEDICFCALTGKACKVLFDKGNKNVKTLHKLLYKNFPLPDGTFKRVPVTSIPYKILIVDEVSLVGKEMIDIINNLKNVYTIYCGDPFQLPVINKDTDNHLLDNANIFLDEIMRQAQESEIIRVSMAIRNGQPLNKMSGKEVVIINKNELNTGMMTWADQIICATNKTRISLNNQMREIYGFDGEPQDGDKVICAKNYWETFSDAEEPLINGTIGHLKNVFSSFVRPPRWIYKDNVPIYYASIETDIGTTYENINMDKKFFIDEQPTLDGKTVYKLMKKNQDIIPKEVAYGYTISCHRAQGSEWEKILVIEERFPFSREEHARWLYTSVTRSSQKLVLVLQ